MIFLSLQGARTGMPRARNVRGLHISERRAPKFFVKAYRSMRKIHYILAIAVFLLVSAIAVAFLAIRSNQRLLDELNSYAESSFEFANYEFFLNLKRNEILLYNLEGKASRTEIGGYVIIVVPLKSNNRTLEGMQNQIHHRNTSVVEYAAYQMLKGNKEIGLSIFRLFLELYPGYYLTGTVNDINKLDRYFPQIERCFRGENYDSSLLEQEAMQFRFKRDTYSLNNLIQRTLRAGR